MPRPLLPLLFLPFLCRTYRMHSCEPNWASHTLREEERSLRIQEQGTPDVWRMALREWLNSKEEERSEIGNAETNRSTRNSLRRGFWGDWRKNLQYGTRWSSVGAQLGFWWSHGVGQGGTVALPWAWKLGFANCQLTLTIFSWKFRFNYCLRHLGRLGFFFYKFFIQFYKIR